MEKVFATPELLEQILLQVPLQDLLTSAQRVNRQWYALTSSSPSLQSALFFRPSAAAAAAAVSPARATGQGPAPEPRPNPLLIKRFPSFERLFWPESLVHRMPRFFGLEPPFLDENASWRRMLIQQRPAARVVGVCARFFSITGDLGERAYRLLGYSAIRYEFADADAVRMSHLVEWVGSSLAVTGIFGVLCVPAQAPEFVKMCFGRGNGNGFDGPEEEAARVGEVVGEADVVLVRELDVASLPPHLRPMDLLLYGPKWNLKKKDSPEPLKVIEFHNATMENWFKEHNTVR